MTRRDAVTMLPPMPFVKLDCGILDSTLWFDRDAREAFLTALLMAMPVKFEGPDAIEEIAPRSLEKTGFSVPPGDYGFVAASSLGIIKRAGLETEAGLAALERLASPEEGSRTPDFNGRRMIRVDGGYLILNYMKYRDRDYTAAIRAQRYRDRRRHAVTTASNAVTSRNITQAEAEAEAEAKEERDTDHFEESFWAVYPRKVGKQQALKAWLRLSAEERLLADEGVRKLAIEWKDRPPEERHFCPHAATWINGKRWQDEPEPVKAAEPKPAPAFDSESVRKEEVLRELEMERKLREKP